MRLYPFIFLAALLVTGTTHAQEPKKDEIAAKEQEIVELDKEIKELQGRRNVTAAEGAKIADQVKLLTQKLAKAQLELEKTQATIQHVKVEQVQTDKDIQSLRETIEVKKSELRGLVRILYEREQESIVRMFFDSWSFSEVLAQHESYRQLQERATGVIQDMRKSEEDLKAKEQELVQQEEDLGQLAQLLAAQQTDVAEQKNAQKQFLQAKKEEQATYENKIKEAEIARKEIAEHVFKLQSSGVQVALNSAYDMARYAGKLTNVRPALLLAVLKVESNVGGNIGSGTYPDDMQPQSREAFVRITKKLGIDINTAQISRRPASGNGWGGAMGPAQIMPATWETIEPRLTQLTGKSTVNPYDLADAFVATAIFLADRGATSQAGEYQAVNQYIAGPNWQYYTWYGDKVMAVAQEYEKDGI